MGNAKRSTASLAAKVIGLGFTAHTGGTACNTCRDYPDVADTSREVLRTWIEEGERGGSFNSLYRNVQQVFPGYKMSQAAFYNHIRRCCKEEYNAALDLPVKLHEEVDA